MLVHAVGDNIYDQILVQHGFAYLNEGNHILDVLADLRKMVCVCTDRTGFVASP